jgi:hypothetical protein
MSYSLNQIFSDGLSQPHRGTSRSPRRNSRSQRSPSSNNNSSRRHCSQPHQSNNPQHYNWHQNHSRENEVHNNASGNFQQNSKSSSYLKIMQKKEPNKGEEPPDDTKQLNSELTGATPLSSTNSAERRIARYKDERRRQLATQIANRLSSNRSFSSSSSTSSSGEDQYRGNGKHKRKRGSLESCSGGSGSLGKLSVETIISGGASRSISNKSGSSYSKYRRYQRSKRPNQDLPLPPSTSAENMPTAQSSMSIFQETANQNNSSSSTAPRRRRRKSFNYDQSHCSPASHLSKGGKSPLVKAQREKKISAAQLGDADGEDDEYDDEIELKDRESEKRPQTFRGECERHSPEHIYHQIGSDALIKVSKRSSSSSQKISRSSLSSSPSRLTGHVKSNNPPLNLLDGQDGNTELVTRKERLEQENNEILLKIKEIKNKIKDIKKPGRAESFNNDLHRSGKKASSAFMPHHSPRSRYLTRAQSFDDKCADYSNEDRSFDDNKVVITSHRTSRKLRKSSFPRGTLIL